MHNRLKLCGRAPIIAAAIAALLAGLYAQSAPAANIAVTNAALYYRDADAGQRFVKLDVSWDVSWRAAWTETGVTPNVTVTNWDAAWIFVKYRPAGSTSGWSHATLSTNNNDHVAPSGSAIVVGLSTNAGGTNFGAGVFLHRSGNSSGSWTNTGVKLRWRYADDGVANAAQVDVCVHAIEMVYVPEGAFYVGATNGGTEANRFYAGGQSTNIPFLITNENQLTIGDVVGQLYYTNMTANAGDRTGILSNAFPKGFGAFYCMKYEISQGQYADFLNQLANSTQATTRYANTNGYFRHTIGGDYPAYTSSAPTRACNYLRWSDGAAYADWAGLRPMTELEYEKACRGPLSPVANEYAWGNTTKIQITNFVGGADGSGTETALPANANVCYNNHANVQGPVRCGIFATATSVRTNSGSSYWGIMELSGNLYERFVTVGHATGRGFTGTHGDGKLTSGGDANVPTWPAGVTPNGSGFRGDSWFDNLSLRASDRFFAAYATGGRANNYGWRAGRSAPGVTP